MFEISPFDPEIYRRQTRRIAVLLLLIFAALAMALSTAAVMLFGSAEADNFRWNLGGVLVGLLLTIALVRFKLWSQPWMAPAVYGWRLKRSLMRVTNAMHRVTRGVEAGDPVAMRVLRFYHLGLTQMHQLDGNSSGLSQMVREIDAHRERMLALGLDIEQTRFEPSWIETLKKA